MKRKDAPRLRAALDLFLGEYDKATTTRAYAGVLLPMADSIGAGRPVNLITAADLHAYCQDVKARTKSAATYQKHIKAIKRFFNWLLSIKEITESPAVTLKQQRLKPGVGKDKAATDEEVELILKVCFGHARNYAIANLIADTGCRAGGVASLRVDNLDLDNLRAVVTEKGDKSRPVWFTEQTAQALREWLIQRPAVKSPWVFCNPDGSPMKSSSVSQVIRRASKDAPGCRSLGPHSFRHRKGHQLADAGVAVTIAAKVLGHEDAKITADFYYPHDYERAEEALRSIHRQERQQPPAPSKIVPLRRSH
jgi:integrase/recombinase XerD